MAVKKRGSRRSSDPTDPAYLLQRLKEDPGLNRMAFYGGTRPQQQLALNELQKGLRKAGHPVVNFNCQKYARQGEVWPLLVQSLVMRLQEGLDELDPIYRKAEKLLEQLDQLIDGDLPQSKKVRLMESVDSQLARMMPEDVGDIALVVLVKGLGTLEPQHMVDLVTFISSSMEIPGLTFVLGLRESAIARGLEEHYHGESPLTPREFIEESFPVFFPLGPEEEAKPKVKEPAEKSPDSSPPPTPAGTPDEPITFKPKASFDVVTEPSASPHQPAGELPELTDVRQRPPPTRLLKMYWDPMLQDKIMELQNSCPSYIDKLENNPELLVILERLARGDSEPRLRQELEVNPFLQSAFGDVVLRSLLARPPYFDPTPVDIDHQFGHGVGIKAMEGMESFEPAEPRGLAVENGASVQSGRDNGALPPLLDDLGPPAAPKPTAKKVAKKKVRKVTGTKKVKRVKKKVRRPVEKREEEPITFKTKAPPATTAETHAPKEEVPKFTVPAEAEDAPLKPYLDAVQAGDMNAVKGLVGQVPGLDEEQAEDLGEDLLDLLKESSNRVKACAAFLLGELRSYISSELAEEVKDQLLLLTSTTQREVREQAAAALAHYRTGTTSRPASAAPAGPFGAPSAPAFKPVSSPSPSGGGSGFAVDDDEDDAVAVAAVAVEDDDDVQSVKAPATFGVVEDDKPKAKAKAKPKTATFGVVEDEKPAKKPATFGVVEDDKPKDKKPATFGVVEDDKPTPTFGVVEDDPPAKTPTFGVVNDEEEMTEAPTFGIVNNDKPKSKAKGGAFKVVD